MQRGFFVCVWYFRKFYLHWTNVTKIVLSSLLNIQDTRVERKSSHTWGVITSFNEKKKNLDYSYVQKNTNRRSIQVIDIFIIFIIIIKKLFFFGGGINFLNFIAIHEKKVSVAFELGTCGSLDRSYTNCATEIHVDTKLWPYKVFHNAPWCGVVIKSRIPGVSRILKCVYHTLRL